MFKSGSKVDFGAKKLGGTMGIEKFSLYISTLEPSSSLTPKYG